jgi:hypothetical protein
MRFDAPELVAAWRKDRSYPAIHDRLFRLVTSEAEGRRFIDLCAGTGLLGRRLTDVGFHGVAVEANRRSILNGAYGNDFLALELRLGPDNLPDLSSWMRAAGVTVVIARRCLPELHDSGIMLAALSASLIDGGAEELFVEGRVWSPRAVHQLASVEQEVEALPDWSVGSRVGACAYLRRRGSYRPAAIDLKTEGSPVASGSAQSSAGAVRS